MSDSLEALYRHADHVRGTFAGNEVLASRYFENYIGFVKQVASPSVYPRLLDIGCGAGWSSYCFAKHGYETTGIDLNAAAFEPSNLPNLTLSEFSALELPFADASFDVVTAYQTLEHIPDPQTALLEMLRVCKQGGVICIVGPNLVSPWQSLKEVFNSLSNRPLRSVFLRDTRMSRHPYGNTLMETMVHVPITLSSLINKLISPQHHFTMRTPDLRPPFHADNDACYLCNPVDLIRFFRQKHCELVQVGKHGRQPLTYLIAGGTWIAARKTS